LPTKAALTRAAPTRNLALVIVGHALERQRF